MELIWALRGLSLQSQNDNVERRWVGEIAMAECKECGKAMGFADKVNAKSYDGKCIGCTKALQDY